MKAKYWWIRERYNPQLGTYYVKMGQISLKDAKAYESGSLYGSNIMHRFTSESDYQLEIQRLLAAGRKVH